MSRSPWAGLGLSEEEWRDCELSAREISLATGARVPARQVATEYARARHEAAERLLRPQLRALDRRS